MPAVNRRHFLLMGPISKLIVLEVLKKAFIVRFSLIHRIKSFRIYADWLLKSLPIGSSDED